MILRVGETERKREIVYIHRSNKIRMHTFEPITQSFSLFTSMILYLHRVSLSVKIKLTEKLLLITMWKIQAFQCNKPKIKQRQRIIIWITMDFCSQVNQIKMHTLCIEKRPNAAILNANANTGKRDSWWRRKERGKKQNQYHTNKEWYKRPSHSQRERHDVIQSEPFNISDCQQQRFISSASLGLFHQNRRKKHHTLATITEKRQRISRKILCGFLFGAVGVFSRRPTTEWTKKTTIN